MTIAVDLGCKATKQTNKQNTSTLKNSVDQFEMQQNIALQQVLHCLILIMLYNFMYTSFLPNFYPVNLQHSIYQHVFSIKVENSVDPDQMATVFLRMYIKIQDQKDELA